MATLVRIHIAPRHNVKFSGITRHVCGCPRMGSICLVSNKFSLVIALRKGALHRVSRFMSSGLSTLSRMLDAGAGFVLGGCGSRKAIVTPGTGSREVVVTW